MADGKWITPFQKQCFVVIGASINMSQIGMVMGFAAALLPQLRAPGAAIPVDESSGSWIAALPGVSLMAGNLIIPTLMAKLGRRKANLISILIIFAGWTCIVVAQDIYWILVARLLQGLSSGMSLCLTPIIIGEYTSPKNRGAFTIIMSLIMATGTLTVHTLGSYVSWKKTACVCAVVTLVDMIVVVMSPETPSWLADHGKYDDCTKNFQWLRGDDEVEELNRMIEASKIERGSRKVTTSLASKVRSSVKKKEFYKPIIIMIHLYIMGQWAGINILAAYIGDMVHETIGTEVDTALVVVSIDVQRVISCVLAVYIIRSVKRRTMLFTCCGLNALILLINAAYIYARANNLLSFDHPVIGGLLLHLLMMTVAIGSLPLPFAIAGEIFPLRFRSLSSGISSFFCSINTFIPVKTFPFLLKSIGIYGAYCLYSGIMVYCLVVVWFLLPETKDRTLQDIEKEFKGKVTDEEMKLAQHLTVAKDAED